MNKKTIQITGILIVSMLTCAGLVAVITLSPLDKGAYTYKLNTFQSYDELLAFLHKRFETGANQTRYYDSLNIMFAKSESGATNDGATQGGEVPPSYSTTNVQVVGVDEPDIVKTDGIYLYIVANQKVFIVKAYPTQNATVLSRIAFDSNTTITSIFIYGDRLVIFGNSYIYPIYPESETIVDRHGGWGLGGESKTVIDIYDVSDRQNPTLAKEIKIDGYYFDARLIDEYVYVVATEYTYDIYYALDEKNFTLNVPQISIDDETQNISAGDIYYVDV
ncbi:MAG: beta-propeller domain-containing protein, partial [Euryarchaeota archaeon]|nr:beta-propeller domain-containing protein [Euryarchaeota archaeon]